MFQLLSIGCSRYWLVHTNCSPKHLQSILSTARVKALPSLCKKASNHHAKYPWKCTVLHCNHLGNTWKPLVLITWHSDYCPSASEGDNQSVRSSAPVVSRCFPSGYNVKLYISRGRLAWWLLAFLCCALQKFAPEFVRWSNSQQQPMELMRGSWQESTQATVLSRFLA